MEHFLNHPTYFVMAVVGSIVYATFIILDLMQERKGLVPAVHPDHVSYKNFFKQAAESWEALSSLFLGIGWSGLALSVHEELSVRQVAGSAILFGIITYLLAVHLTTKYQLLKAKNKYDSTFSIGKEATVFYPIPPRGAGSGLVKFPFYEQDKILCAQNATDQEIAKGEVKIIDLSYNGSVIVEQIPPRDAGEDLGNNASSTV